jgi:pre-mRNA-splicing factor 18
MDLLKAELERKRKALALTKKALSKNATAGELRRVQESVEHQEGLLLSEPARKKSRGSGLSSQTTTKSDTLTITSEEGKQHGNDSVVEPICRQEKDEGMIDDSANASASKKSSSADHRAATTATVNRKEDEKALRDELRSFGLPVRLFAETIAMQRNRLVEARKSAKAQALDQTERSEFNLQAGYGIRNTFLDKNKNNSIEASSKVEHNIGSKRDASAAATDKNKAKSAELSDENVKNDPHKRIYRHFKDILKQWEADIDHAAENPDPSKPAASRRNEIKTYKQCKDYIRPLFKLLQRRTVEPQMLKNLLKIVHHSERDEYVQAHSAYMDVAIGRAAWPIGVTAVGIHARTGRSKIESNNVAHVMNSELQRKYLTSVKRLLTYRQSKAVDVDPSRKVLM